MSRVFRRISLALSLLLLASGGPLAHVGLAQNVTSHLTGNVSDAQGAVLPGVTVTATSPALIGTQTVVTESNGAYLFPSLPAGTYTITFTLQGFQTFTRSNIVLALGQTLTVNAQLQLAAVKENVTVTAEAPVVDTQSTAVGSTLNTQKLISVPTSTDLWGALGRSPGVRMTGFDVGGSHKSEQSGYEAFGVRSQGRIVTEGVDTTEGTGGTGFYQDYYSQSEISVSAAGQDVSMNTPGAAVISTIKSGGNTFKGLYNLAYEPHAFVGNNIDAATSARGYTGTPNYLFWEGHADLGGPIKKDKLWFFAAYNHFTIDEAISGVPPTRARYKGIYNNFTTKETWKATSKDTVIGYYQYGGLETPNRGLSALTQPDASVLQKAYTWMYNGKYQRVWSNRLFSELNIGDFGYHFPESPLVDYRVDPPRLDLATGLQTGAAANIFGTGPFLIERNKPQIFGTLSYFLPSAHGSHDLKAGFEWLNDRQVFNRTGQAGDVLYLDFNGQPDEVQLFNFGDPSTLGSAWTGPNNVNRRTALYFQDRWTASNRVTVTAGIRYDRQRPYYLTSKTAPTLSYLFAAQTFPGQTVMVRNTVVPRVGVSWDPKGDGRAALKAFYGRYYFNLAQSFSAVNPGGPQSRTYKFNDLNGNRLYDGPQELGTLVATSGSVTTTLDQNIKVPYTDEFDLSYQRQFWQEASFTIAYVRKMERNNFTTYNAAWDGQFTVPLTVPVTLVNYPGTVQGVQDFNLMDVPTSLKGVIQNTIANIPASVGGGSFNYDTLELTLNKRFPNGLFLDSSFDYQWRDELRQNFAVTNPFSSDPLGVNYFQNVYPAVSNRQKSTNWQAHVSGFYRLPYEIGVGLNVQVQSGFAWARLVTARLPNAGTQTFFMENIDNNRSPTVPLVHLRLDRAFPIGSHRLTAMFDLDNVLNSNAVTNFNLRNGNSFNQIIATLQPRTAQVGLRFEF
ncbi:MAG: TonB-dependent receptor [Acidobacteriota bacterium]|nr:TonB-dependent receptor [Acidobacteriota bacterium]